MRIATEPGAAQAALPAPATSSARGVRRLLPYFLTASLLAIPCFWLPHIQGEDLPSHLYNAWLVSEVQAGKVPGLYVVPQYTNVLFDHLLSLLLGAGSLYLTEHVAVLVAVQVFFWGCFAFASTVAGRRAWHVVPILMMIAYGAVFRMGFFNFYMGVGLGVMAISLVWQNSPRARWLAVPLLGVAFLAHVIPFVWSILVIAYVLVARSVRSRQRGWLLAAAMLAVAGIALLLKVRASALWPAAVPLLSAFGIDQLLTFGLKYGIPAAALLSLSVLLLIHGFDSGQLKFDSIAFGLWALSAAACLLLPDAIATPFYAGILTWISIRLSLLAAILLCATLAAVRWRPVERVFAWLLLSAFLSFTYVDERAIGSVEQRMAKAVEALPAGTRVISTLADSHLFVTFLGVPRGVAALEHLADRVCIGRCFSFGSYEAATTQFRLRARPGNPYMVSDPNDASALEHGEYVWERRDIDLYKLYPCETGGGICTAQVKPGERLAKHEFAAVPMWRSD